MFFKYLVTKSDNVANEISMNDKWVSIPEGNVSSSKNVVSFSIKDDKVGTISTWEDEDAEWEYYMPTNDVS